MFSESHDLAQICRLLVVGLPDPRVHQKAASGKK